MRRTIKSPQRGGRVVAIKLDGTGTAAIAGPDNFGVSLVDNGTGDYSIAFDEPFTQIPVVVATPSTATSHIQVDALAVDGFDILGFAMDGTTAQDVECEIVIFGLDADENR